MTCYSVLKVKNLTKEKVTKEVKFTSSNELALAPSPCPERVKFGARPRPSGGTEMQDVDDFMVSR